MYLPGKLSSCASHSRGAPGSVQGSDVLSPVLAPVVLGVLGLGVGGRAEVGRGALHRRPDGVRPDPAGAPAVGYGRPRATVIGQGRGTLRNHCTFFYLAIDIPLPVLASFANGEK